MTTAEQPEGVALSVAVGRALGWVLIGNPSNEAHASWADASGKYQGCTECGDGPDFTTPEGEHRLRAEIERMGRDYQIFAYQRDGVWGYSAIIDGVYGSMDRWMHFGTGPTAATALGRAFLKAIEQ